MKILHISDTHGFHNLLNIPEGIDMIIHSGDCSNYREPYKNEPEVRDFIAWYSKLDIPFKIYVCGNHDTSVEAGYLNRSHFEQEGIIYLENESTEIKGIKIWGSPITPSFGVGWAFNKKRDKLHDLWQSIPEDTDIVITHGPAKGCLDLSYNRFGALEFCGCEALRKRMIKLKPKLVCFGHIHSMDGIVNAGTLKLSTHDTIYSNGSVVEDGKFGKLSSQGNIFEI